MFKDSRSVFSFLPEIMMTFVGLLIVVQDVAAEEYVVVVNEANNYSAEKATAGQVIKQLFLKERSSWPDGTAGKPFSPKRGGDSYKVYIESILSMGEAELSRHWITLKSKTGATAPREIKSDAMILKIVGRYKGGFGIVSSEAAKNAPGVKVLFTLP